jgi:hypothetical protein
MKNHVYRAPQHDLNAPPYDKPCLACGAQPGQLCKQSTGIPARYTAPHKTRSKTEKPTHMPDLSAWWRSVRPYEGKGAKPRPADLVIP